MQMTLFYILIHLHFLKGILTFDMTLNLFSEQGWFQVTMSSFPTQLFAKVERNKFNY